MPDILADIGASLGGSRKKRTTFRRLCKSIFDTSRHVIQRENPPREAAYGDD